MYVFRESGEPEDVPVAAEPDDREAAYWYGTAEPEPEPVQEETRGPFEPLVSSGEEQRPGGPSVYTATVGTGPADESAPADDDPDDPADRHAQKLQQIKDFYLTAEAIGEENVDKHFDQLLAQQRDLISEYFKHSDTAKRGADGGTPGQMPEASAGAEDGAGAQAAEAGAAGRDEATQAGAASTSTDWLSRKITRVPTPTARIVDQKVRKVSIPE